MTEHTAIKDIKEQTETARPGMIDTIIHLGTATTNLAIDQVGNAFNALARPGEAIAHVKDTLLNLSDAMNNSVGSSREDARAKEHPASDLRGASDGMGYVATSHTQATVAEVRRPAVTPAKKMRTVKINHRKG